ncbi:flagellar hook-length control protein FliK [Cupriavidus pauculus]|uniref:Flagellar hook-length control protein FliK n=1 Tax=Cupriavidus pauculus TaxID=82633 RepID=A0A5P2HDE7_9BURK|nr:flagellar hook-length control protein FliK [Cupriavidus pauculus]QET05848.1 flagellar hook-length control protein FliK [Cupriavidus pauculus]
MIDISKILGTGAAKATGTAGVGGSTIDAAFQDALSRARDKAPRQQNNATSQPVNVGKPASKVAEKGNQKAAEKPADKPAAQEANKPADKSASKSDPSDGKTTQAAKADEDKKDTDTAQSAEDAAKEAAAAAAALALAMLGQPPAQQTTAGNATDTVDPALAGLSSLPGVNGAAGTAAQQGAATNQITATSAAAAQAAATAATQADAAAAQTDTVAAQTTLPAEVSVTKATTMSPADTLATIAQQRAAAQATTGTADKPAQPSITPSALANQDAHGGQTGGHSGSQQSQAGLGQPAQAAQPQTAANTSAAGTAGASYAAAQANARTGEGTDTGATNSSSAATLASAIAAQAPTPAAQATAAAAARAVVAPNVGDNNWSQALGQHMVRMSTQGSQTAELDLNPPNLGPLKVVLNVVNDQAQAQFVSPHQAVRAAVESALPHLRTSLAESGIQLGHTSVGSEGFANQAGNGQQQQQRQSFAGGQGSSFGQASNFGNEPAVPVARPQRVLAQGEVDTFA